MSEIHKLYVIETHRSTRSVFSLESFLAIAKPRRVELFPFDYLLASLRLSLRAALTEEWGTSVVCVGAAGERLFREMEHCLCFSSITRINISRKFMFNASGSLELADFLVNATERPILSTAANILIFDDVVYSGSTIRKVIELLGLTEHHRIYVACLFAFTPVEDAALMQIIGTCVPREQLWPAGNVELVDVMDMHNPHALRFTDGRACSLIEVPSLANNLVVIPTPFNISPPA